MQHHEVVQSRLSRCLSANTSSAEKDLSLTALVAGMTSNSFPRVEISLNSFLRELSRDCKKVTKSLTSNSEVSNPTDSAICAKSKRCSLHLKDILKLLVVFGRAKIRFRSFTQFQIVHVQLIDNTLKL